MGKAPAVIIIARHGARLDQADKQWHLTSPTPYDPPLTYGGWTQARALGARIGGILRAREEEQEDIKGNGMTSGASEQTGQKRKRKHKIIIHSSPFVRCVQTSIAIGAGIGQFRGRAPSMAKHHTMHSGSPHIHALENSPGLSAIPEPAEDFPTTPLLPEPSPLPPNPDPAAPLASAPLIPGEWLSPDYFENITPPPESVMMVASAKADLLRPGEAIEGSDSGRRTHGNFPGGWSSDWSASSSADESEEKTGLANMAALGHALSHSLPNRTRSSTHSSDSPGSSYSRRYPSKPNTSLITANPNDDLAYVPPTPTYAISSSDAIPVGYVAHARDACIDVSYQWDSMRPPQCWGNGGEYGEEWSSMHRRLRNGLSKMIEWYEEHGTAVNKAAEMFVDMAEEEATDTVLILVTHGAGCNALLGALTNQPVLLDVGMASLTMAVRKRGVAKSARQKRSEIEDANSTNNTNAPSSARRNGRRGSIDLGIAEDYEMKFTASTDHLRAGSNPLSGSAGSPRIGSSASNSPSRRPATSFSSDSFTIGEGAATFSTGPSARAITAGAAFSSAGGLHRSKSGHSAMRNGMYPAISSAPKVSSGLWRSGTMWSSNSNNEGTSESGGENDPLPDFVSMNAKSIAACATRGLDGSNDLGLRRKDSNVAPDEQVRPGEEEQQQEQQQQQQEEEEEQDTEVNGNGTQALNRSTTPIASSKPYNQLKSSPYTRTHAHTPTRTASQMGLWGNGFKKDSNMPKRRWTVVENPAG
ncbi:hypothetical protein GJ744_012219 [Endocarpon pusillum]|uniref:Phosphoglycerate mutase n=1 Tax=Endocarpon pusillum TaxID=364733 RepID=A0A8H7E2B2_9EURO|nr:hypothetical protein GJ744_012219 [Endocarpon pusillum]